MTVWRLQTQTNGGAIGQFCLDNKVAALGWSLVDVVQSEREQISTYEQFEAYAEDAYDSFGSVNRLTEVKQGDFIWMRHKGRYYFARVSKASSWRFDSSEDAKKHDAANQLTDVDWLTFKEADESTVPGAISTAFIKGSTLQRIKKDGVEEFSKLMYNRITGERLPVNLELNKSNFYNMLSPSDCEDLLCMWLYFKPEFRYICIPSTNKNATPLYECVLLDPKNGKHVYIQVKNGEVDIDAYDYAHLKGEVWLLTTKGNVKNYENEGREKKHKHINVADPNALYEFAISEEAENILPPSIKAWVNLLEENEHQKAAGQRKGIIFDTNKSYDETAQEYMISRNRVSAWGDASRFVDRFNLGDYVLYCEKGKGIFAVATITSKSSMVEGDEKYQTVSMIVPNQGKYMKRGELQDLLKKNFYFASTAKTPYLSEAEVLKVCEALKSK